MLTLHHAPRSRSTGILWLLEELEVPFDLQVVDIRRSVAEEYRRIHPHKKVPALQDGGTIVTERAAICLYLCEKFPEAGLAPPVGDAHRAAFLSGLVYCDAVIDPCIAVRAQGWEGDPSGLSFGRFEDMARHLERQLEAGPYALGDTFTALDTQLGCAVLWGLQLFSLLPDSPVFRAYLARVTARPAFQRAMARDQQLAG